MECQPRPIEELLAMRFDLASLAIGARVKVKKMRESSEEVTEPRSDGVRIRNMDELRGWLGRRKK